MLPRILEYLNREDADRAVKELDGRELRGRPVRVAFDDSVSLSKLRNVDMLLMTHSVPGPTTIVGMTAEKTATTERIVTRTTEVIAATDLDLLAVHKNMTIVVPGLRPPGGRLMIEGLQGTMITGEEAMMTVEGLIIIMIVVGMNLTGAETTEDVKRRMNASKKGLQGTRTGMADGPVEEI